MAGTKTISTSNTMLSFYTNIQQKIDIIVELDKKLLKVSANTAKYKWDDNKDSRALFIKYINELNLNTILAFSFQAESYSSSLIEDKTWLKARLPHYESKIDSLTIPELENFSANQHSHIAKKLWDNFIFGYFFEFETRLRNIVKKLNINSIDNPKKILNGTEAFNVLYRSLYKRLNMKKKDIQVLNMFSMIRNSIHNSGFYMNTNEQKRSISYRGISYQFSHGKPINFITEEFVKTLLEDTILLWEKIITQKCVSNISVIEDPVSKVKFTII